MTMPKLFTVVLSTGVVEVMAPDSEHAAWIALELSEDRDAKLLDVRPTVNYDW